MVVGGEAQREFGVSFLGISFVDDNVSNGVKNRRRTNVFVSRETCLIGAYVDLQNRMCEQQGTVVDGKIGDEIECKKLLKI